jgi:hypothetical protein
VSLLEIKSATEDAHDQPGRSGENRIWLRHPASTSLDLAGGGLDLAGSSSTWSSIVTGGSELVGSG